VGCFSSRARAIGQGKPVVESGKHVTLVDEDTEQEKKYQIVGDLKVGRVSISSPIARALIGKQVGDSVEVSAPGGSRAYEITAVRLARGADAARREALAAVTGCCRQGDLARIDDFRGFRDVRKADIADAQIP